VNIDSTLWLNLAVALGIGLLIGTERERKKSTGLDRSSAGIRTFTIASLLGAVSTLVNFWLLVASLFCILIFAATAYFTQRNQDPGLTTEISLIFTVILGGLAMNAAALAAALAVSVAILLAAKGPIHSFVLSVISNEELNDFLMLAAATLIILPLVPNKSIGPFEAINPHNLWIIVVLVMVISALGHIALRLLGGRIGLPIVGLVSGFISSIATINTMGERVKETPTLMSSAVAGAVLSSLATILLLSMLLAAIDPRTLLAMAWPLIFGGIATAIYGLVLTLNSFHNNGADTNKPTKMFSVKSAITFAAAIAVAVVSAAALRAWFGQLGLVVATSTVGLVDVHAATVSIATLSAADKLSAADATMLILLAFSFNSIAKAVTALVSGGKDFARQVILGLVVQVAATWMGWWFF
jgi:uncharacterized membrane protein (DUF4010 family)